MDTKNVATTPETANIPALATDIRRHAHEAEAYLHAARQYVDQLFVAVADETGELRDNLSRDYMLRTLGAIFAAESEIERIMSAVREVSR